MTTRKPRKTNVEIGGVSLTVRERAALQALATGHDSTKALARAIGVEPATAADFLRKVFRKLGVRSRVAAAVWAVRNGVA